MIQASISRRINRTARRFIHAKDGNIAVTFALVSVVLVCFVGAAIDYSRAATARSAMQAALDSTVLMVAKDLSSGVVQTSGVNSATNHYFQGLFASYTTANHRDAFVDSITATYTPSNGTTPATISATASGHIDTEFMKVAALLVPGSSGFATMGFGTSSTSTWGNVKMRVALVLDNTGSMAQNNKIGALKTAVAGTGGLIDQLSALSHNSGDVYISIVPFAKVVNVGALVNGGNIDWTDWLNPPTQQPNNHTHQATLPMNWHAVGPGARCPFSNSSGGFPCTTSPVNGSSTTNSVPSSGTYSGYICPGVDANSHTLYNGCWTSTPANPSSGVFCSGSSSCSCPTTSSGSAVAGCSCSGSGSGKSCTGNLYVHNWTQPSVSGSQPAAVTANVGYLNNSWTPTNSTPTVANVWTAASTNPTSTWTGCVTDRTQPNDATGVQPTSGDPTTQFPANQYYENSTAYCSSSASTQLQSVIRMSESWTTLKSAINSMQPTGGTDQAVGLAWGWQSLIVGGVLNAPAEDANTIYNRVIILLSDGLNTEDRWPDYGDGSNQNTGSNDPQFPGLIDARQRVLCDNLKNARDSQNRPMYTIYTIQANTATPADPTSAILQYCASSPDKFYELTSSNAIITTFQSIGTALSNLRVSM
jgi:Flp pilus assembly protein TadG